MHARGGQQRHRAREGRRNVRLQVGSRHLRRTVNDKPSFRPRYSLANIDGLAGRLAALEVSGVAPSPKQCHSGPALLEKRDASRRSSSPTLHEARTGAGAGNSQQRIWRGWAPVAGRPHPSAAHATQPSRLPRNCHCDARGESAEGPDDSSQGVLGPAATSASSLWAHQNFALDSRGSVVWPVCRIIPSHRL